MSFDYDRGTKAFYQSDEVAQAYHRDYTERKGLNGLRFRFVAAREQAAVRRLLRLVPHRTVLDVPAGTGKMALVFAEFGCRVTAGDVSENMLAIARNSYAQAGCEVDEFRVVDLEKATSKLIGPFDVVVCVRLMQRVPDEVRTRMLGEIAKLAERAIITFGVETPYGRVRRRIRRALLGGDDMGVETRGSLPQILCLLNEHFVVKQHIPIARGLSSEWVFLVERRSARVA